MVIAGEVIQGERGAAGHGTFGEKAKVQSSRWSRTALGAAGAVAVVVVVALAGCVSMQERPAELFEDVTHDAAVSEVGGGHMAVRRRGQALSAHSSIADFFHAAMRGDFEKNENNVQLATEGLFNSHDSPSPAKYQSLASRGRMRAKAVHMAHAGGMAVHKQLLKPKVLAARKQMLPGGVVVHAPKRLHGVSEKQWMFPSEDKFVARYTGSLPPGDVMVDTFTNGPYTPL